MKRAWLALALGCACHCGNSPLGGAAVGFTVSGELVDFGRVLENAQESRSVTVVSAGRVDLVVDVSTSGPPFSAPTSVTVPAGGSVDVAVVFTAGVTVATGSLQLSNEGKSVSVPLRGEGVQPLPCIAPAPCYTSTFDLASGTCLIAMSPDGTMCSSPDQCLDNTVCRGGACVGTARNCDDGDVCTQDLCSSTQGCVHRPVSCPPPTKVCQQTTCDPGAGCGFGPAPEGQPCGPIDCVTANLCFSGSCQSVPTPDGFVCAPATPCQGVGTCESQQCVRPDAGDLPVSFHVNLDRAPSRVDDLASSFLTFQGNLFWTACDGGCALESFTFNGFRRFVQPLSDGGARWLVGVTDAGLIVETDGAIEAFDSAVGAPLWSFSLGTGVTSGGRTAIRADGTLFTAFTDPDSGIETLLVLPVDGGATFTPRADAGTRSLVALDRPANAFTYDGTLFRGSPVDGGLTWSSLGTFAGVPSLVLSDDAALVGGTWEVPLDGGAAFGPLVPDGGMPWYPDPRIALAAEGVGYLIERACLPPLVDPCADTDKTSFLVAVDLATGLSVWATEAAPPGFATRFEEASLVTGGGALLLSQTQLDGGTEADLQLFDAFGERGFVCRLPPPGVLGGAAFDNGLLYVLIFRDPNWRLEAYDLNGVPLESGGWPLRNGVSGTRQER